MTQALLRRNGPRWLWRATIAAFAVSLNALNVLVLATQSVNDAQHEFGFSPWAILWGALAVVPFIVAFLQWRQGRRDRLVLEEVLWRCMVSLVEVGLVSILFVLAIIAI